MTDDLKQRLRERQATAGFYSPKPGVIRAVYRDDTLTTEALAYITNLEARLAAAVEVQDRLMSERYQQYLRAEAAEANVNRLQEGEARLSLLLNETAQARDAAEAGEDALAEALRPFGFFSDEPNTTQQAWEIRYCDRFEDWIDFGDMESARDALAAYDARRKG